jgi:tRNA A-37 threonylcarbamoyl transferase component Bud32
MVELIDLALKWLVAPLLAVAWYLHRTVHAQGVDIAVLKAVLQANKEVHDREFKEVKTNFKAVMDKLDSIEQYLRK